MLLRLSVILILFIGLAMYAVGDGPEKDRVALALERAEAQRASSTAVSRSAPNVVELAVETPKVEAVTAPEPVQQAAVRNEIATQPADTAPQAQTASLNVAAQTPVLEQPLPKPEVETQAQPELEPELIELYVTGRRVNLRAGPSTDNAVIGRVVRGQAVELVDYEDNGWARIRVAGVEGEAFMSGDFLSDQR